MRFKCFLYVAAVSVLAVSCKTSDVNEKLNAQARTEYLQPIHPGSADGSVSFWNAYATKFIYAPAFDFKAVEGAESYRFTIVSADSLSWSFTASEPTAALSPVWDDVKVGDVTLTVEALDADGKAIGVAGERKFRRDYPFHGPYRQNLYSYDECIRRGLSYVHNMPCIKYWQEHDTPDMSNEYNSYLCKIMGNSIRVELLYAEAFPKQKESVLQRCRNIASFIISQSEPADAKLAYFPPTYYGSFKAAAREENQGKTMAMEAIEVVNAFFDLYKACGDRQYFDHALHILDTYRKIQRPDGSFPVKMDLKTGEPVNDANGSPHTIFMVLNRLEKEFGVYDYKDFRESIEKWVAEVEISSFNWNGQFEDTAVEGVKPYENMTNCTAAPVAIYLMMKDNPSESDLRTAEELVRFCEDQFVYWDSERVDGVPVTNTPCAYEQYKWKEPTDASTSYILSCFVLMYKHTGDELWLAKASALAANITFMQNKVTGMIPTWGWRNSRLHNTDADKFWINCTRHSVATLKLFKEITGQE